MARGMVSGLNPDAKQKLKGWINIVEDPNKNQGLYENIRLFAARPKGLNLPTPQVAEGTEQIKKMLLECDPDDLVVGLFSGGGSALLESPIPPMTMEHIIAVTTELTRSGASIQQLNCVRKALSHVKGGKLTRFSKSRFVHSLYISDILGGELADIASGPTVPHSNMTTTAALDIINQMISNPSDRVSEIATWLKQTQEEEYADDTATFNGQTRNELVASNAQAVQAAQSCASVMGYQLLDASILNVVGSVEELADQLADQIVEAVKMNARVALITGCEPTIRAQFLGDGGRNQHLVLCVLNRVLDQIKTDAFQFCLLSGGTDGEDGNSTASGGYIDDHLLGQVTPDASKRAALEQAISTHSSHEFLSEFSRVFYSGETKTNVADLVILIVEPNVP